MRILQVCMHQGSGGAETVATLLNDAWNAAGDDSEIAYVSQAYSNTETDTERFPAFRRIHSLLKSILTARPELIVCHGTIAGLYARSALIITILLVRARHIRVLVVNHSASDDYADRKLMLIEHLVSSAKPAKWLAVSNDGVAAVSRARFRGSASVKLVKNPVDPRLTQVERTPRNGLIVMLGRVVPQKDYLLALELLDQGALRPHVKSVEIYGTMDNFRYAEEVRSRIDELKFADIVHLCGETPDPSGPLARAAVLLHTASREGAAMVLREASFAGVPIAATPEAAAGVPEVELEVTIDRSRLSTTATQLANLLSSDISRSRPPIGEFDPGSIAQFYVEHSL